MDYSKCLIILLILFCVLKRFCCQENVGSFAHSCNSTIHDGQGILPSPNFPQLYPSNSFCQWQVTVEENRNIQLSFSHFELETTPGCAYDRVLVFNGPSKAHPLLGKFCGSFRPADVITTSNRMLMTFESDGSDERSGFLAVFISIAPQIAGLNSCGGLLTGTSGTFHSVDFPKFNYPNSMTCVWHIRAPEDHHIALNFAKMTLEISTNCRYDSITVFGGWSRRTDTKFLGRFCELDDVSDEITSTGNEMFVTFATDSSGNDVGFSATYTTKMTSLPTTNADQPTVAATTDVCSETIVLSNDTGEVVSPGYNDPRGYPPNLQCSWRIVSSLNTRIALRFENFELEQAGDIRCSFDYVAVYSGRITSGVEIDRFCGSLEDQTVYSIGNEMFVLFVSDSGEGNAGFRAFYSAVSLQESSDTTVANVDSTTRLPSTTLSFTTIAPTTGANSTQVQTTATSCAVFCSNSVNTSSTACSAAFVAYLKVLNKQVLDSGVTRVRVQLIRMLKLDIEGVSRKKKTKFWMDITCPACHPPVIRRSRYIFAGRDLNNTGGQINPTDYIEVFSKSILKTWKKDIRRCDKRRHDHARLKTPSN